MGSSESSEVSGRVTIERAKEDASFDIVHVSENVVNRLTNGQHTQHKISTNGGDTGNQQQQQTEQDELMWQKLLEERAMNNHLRADLTRSQTELDDLRERMNRLENLGNSHTRSHRDQSSLERKIRDLTSEQTSLQESMKSAFKESVDRISRQFFSVQNDTACAELESKLLQCYMDSPGKVLKCSPLAKQFERCVKEHRAEMLARNA